MDTKAQKINTHIENIILKNKLLNKGLITVKIKENKYAYIMDLNNDNYRLYIPNNIETEEDVLTLNEELFNTFKGLKASKASQNSMGCRTPIGDNLYARLNNLEIIGGTGLKTVVLLVSRLCINELNINKLYMPHLDDLSHMLSGCTINKIIFGEFNTSNIKYMNRTFAHSTIMELDISSLNLINLLSAESMFEQSKIKNLKIGKHTSLFLRNTAEMFSFSNIPEIDLSEWYAPNILKMSEMFSCCSALKINMIDMGFGGFNRVKECDMLFYNFKGQINSSDKEFMRKFSR